MVAREEERRRLRRDLHDGLGPTLAGLTMRAEAAQALAGAGGPESGRLLDEIITDAQTAVADVRRLVEGLRPPALDTLGLAGALDAHLAGRPGGDGPQVRFARPADLPALGAATEVAAYRIAVEAVANARRHARATTVDVGLAVHGDRLVVRVDDDGRGCAPETPAGVGLHSMRERAEELGDTLTVGGRPGGGTRVRADLPLGED